MKCRFCVLLVVAAATVFAANSNPAVDVTDPRILVPSRTRPLFDAWLRDTYAMLGPDGYYYLTGTISQTLHGDDSNDGVYLWRSPDLHQWESVGLVWSLEREGTWQRQPAKLKPGRVEKGDPNKRALWAPELHYIKSRKAWLIVACVNGGRGSFVLRSKSGKPEGPYESIPGNVDGPLFDDIDSSLFEDDDGTVYFLGHNHFIARMKDDLSGLAEPISRVTESPFKPEPYCEGMFIVKEGGLYHLVQTFFSFPTPDGSYSYVETRENSPLRRTYDSVISSSKDIRGPYGQRYTCLVNGGHNNLFRDKSGQWWSTMFGNPRVSSGKEAPFLCRPALVPMKYVDGRFMPDPSRVPRLPPAPAPAAPVVRAPASADGAGTPPSRSDRSQTRTQSSPSSSRSQAGDRGVISTS